MDYRPGPALYFCKSFKVNIHPVVYTTIYIYISYCELPRVFVLLLITISLAELGGFDALYIFFFFPKLGVRRLPGPKVVTNASEFILFFRLFRSKIIFHFRVIFGAY